MLLWPNNPLLVNYRPPFQCLNYTIPYIETCIFYVCIFFILFYVECRRKKKILFNDGEKKEKRMTWSEDDGRSDDRIVITLNIFEILSFAGGITNDDTIII